MGKFIEVFDRFEKFCLIVKMHFPQVREGDIDSLNCAICQDFIEKNCDGKALEGALVLDCMIAKIDKSSIDQCEAFLQ
jgi:hypothetical protein